MVIYEIKHATDNVGLFQVLVTVSLHRLLEATSFKQSFEC